MKKAIFVPVFTVCILTVFNLPSQASRWGQPEPALSIQTVTDQYRIKGFSPTGVMIRMKAHSPLATVESLLMKQRKEYDADIDEVASAGGVDKEALARHRDQIWGNALKVGENTFKKMFIPAIAVIGHPAHVKAVAAMAAWDHYLEGMSEFDL